MTHSPSLPDLRSAIDCTTEILAQSDNPEVRDALDMECRRLREQVDVLTVSDGAGVVAIAREVVGVMDRVQGVVKVNGGEVDQRFLGIKKQLNGDKDRVENLVHKEFYKGSDYLKNSDLIMQMFHIALGKEAYAKLENMRGQTITEITLKSNNLRINVGGIGNEKLNDRIESGDNQDKDFKWATCLNAYGNRKKSKEAVVNILKKVFGITLDLEEKTGKPFLIGKDYLDRPDHVKAMFRIALGEEAYAKIENMRGQAITKKDLESNNLRINTESIGNKKQNDRIESGDDQDKDFKWATCLYSYGNGKPSKEAVVTMLDTVFKITLDIRSESERQESETRTTIRTYFPTHESITEFQSVLHSMGMNTEAIKNGAISLLFLCHPDLQTHEKTVRKVMDDMKSDNPEAPPPPIEKNPLDWVKLLENIETHDYLLKFFYDGMVATCKTKNDENIESIKQKVITAIDNIPLENEEKRKTLQKALRELVKVIDDIQNTKFDGLNTIREGKNAPDESITPNGYLQQEALYWGSRLHRILVAYPVGGGKSYIAYGLKRNIELEENKLESGKPTLIVTTDNMVPDFARKIAHMEGIATNPDTAEYKKAPLKELYADLRKIGILVVTPEVDESEINRDEFHTILINQSLVNGKKDENGKMIESRHFAALQAYDPEIMILDESHMIKNTASNTYENLASMLCEYDSLKTRRVIQLTATPMMSSVQDFVSQAMLCDPWRAFAPDEQAEIKADPAKQDEFCKMVFKNIRDMRTKVIENPSLVRGYVREHYLFDRAPEFDLDSHRSDVQLSDEEHAHIHEIREGNTGYKIDEKSEKLPMWDMNDPQSGMDVNAKRWAIDKHLVHPGGPKYEHILAQITDQPRIVITTQNLLSGFTNNNENGTSWKNKLEVDLKGNGYEICTVDGSVNKNTERQATFNKWQSGKGKMIMLVNQSTINFGQNLTCGEIPIEAFIAHLPWTASEIIQLFGRFDREGQFGEVTKNILVSDCKYEQEKAKRIQDVFDIIKCIMEGKPLTEDQKKTLEEIWETQNWEDPVKSDYQQQMNIFNTEKSYNYEYADLTLEEKKKKSQRETAVSKIRAIYETKDKETGKVTPVMRKDGRTQAQFTQDFHDENITLDNADKFPSIGSNRRLAQKLVNEGFTGRILDVGAGGGTLSRLYIQECASQGKPDDKVKFINLDVVADILKTNGGVSATMNHLPFVTDTTETENSIDMVTNCFSLHIMGNGLNITPKARETIQEMIRVVKSGGDVVITVPLKVLNCEERFLEYVDQLENVIETNNIGATITDYDTDGWDSEDNYRKYRYGKIVLRKEEN